MHRLPRWPCHFAALGTLALAGVLLTSACQAADPADSAATAEPVDSWAAAAARAEAATFLLFADNLAEWSPHEDYMPARGVAFYIGNDEWITEGDLGSDFQYAIRQGEYKWLPGRSLGDDLRPVRVIGYDAATGISLLAASGDGVLPLRWAAAIPPLCTPVRLAGYWEGLEDSVTAWATEVAAALRFPDPAACDPAVPPPAGFRRVIVDVLLQPDYFVPGTVGAALGGGGHRGRDCPGATVPVRRHEPSDAVRRWLVVRGAACDRDGGRGRGAAHRTRVPSHRRPRRP